MIYSSLTAFNANRARLLIDPLSDQGISHFCISPGSSSSALAIAIGEHPKAQASIHFDERGLGFYALGLAKATSTPVVVLVTTGTAVANLFPAIMEAHLSRTSLLILTADRPPELRDCGANQTSDHVKIFSSFVRWEIDLALSDPLASDEYIASSLAHAVNRSGNTPKGPVHINCMIREPFIHLEPLIDTNVSSCIYEPKETHIPISSFKQWADTLSQKEKGVILLGSDAIETKKDLHSFLTLADELNWPIFSDIISGGRQIGNHPHHIEYFELILKSLPDIEVDAFLQIGNRFVSKSLGQWIQKQKNVPYFLLANHPFRQDPLHKVSRRMECSTDLFCQNLLPYIPKGSNTWVSFWKSAATEVRQTVLNNVLEQKKLSEPFLFAFLSTHGSSFPVYLSSSMPVRDADLLYYPPNGSSQVFCNRGTSGIDGNIATAAGIAKGLQKPLVAVIGDLAALHDLSSFAIASQRQTPILFL